VMIRRCVAATSEIERLDAKHRDVWKSIDEFERLLVAGLAVAHDLYPALGLRRGDESARIFKARVLCRSLGGKSSGLRYVYERLTIDGEEHAIALTVYIHQQGAKEHDIVKKIKDRFSSYDATADGIRLLEKSAANLR
jgi:hypothetical protein